ncbi:MAG: adenylosuccinate synthase [Actinomycetota bacterium]
MPATVLVGAQWGDEGKGRAIDQLAPHSDIVIRYQGGNNAGHTVIAGDVKLALHLIPSSVLHERPIPMLGDGLVIDPEALLEEMDMLGEQGISTERLKVSGNAHLIMPYHRALDAVSERFLGRAQLGTTKKGIGPAYADKAARIGLRVQDLLDLKIFEQKLQINLKEKNAVLARIYNRLGMDGGEIIDAYSAFAERLRPHIADTGALVHRCLTSGGSVLFEGAQGTMLDLDQGTYPFVTSSSPSAGGACTGTGIGPRFIDEVVGLVKAYTTRVGAGPFPTELEDGIGEHLGRVGAEFGVTTGRKRRCGWLDAVQLRYAVRVNSMSKIFLTKLDVLSGLDPVKISTAYDSDGERYEQLPPNQTLFHHAKPVYEELPGWTEDLSGCEKLGDLPKEARRYIERVEELTGTPVAWIGVGPAREQTIVVDA